MCPYELRICNKCYWHTVQDEGHVIVDCPSQDLTYQHAQLQHVFCSVPPSIASCFRNFRNQAAILGLAKFVSACLKCCDRASSIALVKSMPHFLSTTSLFYTSTFPTGCPV
eukprot:28687-Pelagomonas_calceolata.AAC.2